MRMRLFSSVIVLTVLWLTLSVHAATGTLSGTLLDADGKTVANQKVQIKKVVSREPIGKNVRHNLQLNLTVATLTTDKDGKFTHTLEPGEYWAEAGSKTLGYVKERFEIQPGQETSLKLSLVKDEAG